MALKKKLFDGEGLAYHKSDLPSLFSTKDVDVASKEKHGGKGMPALQDALPQRIARARGEGRFQHALELVRSLYKQDPTDQHLELLRSVSIERGEELQRQGKLQDAVTLFGNAAQLGGSRDFLESLAGRLASCGALFKALDLLVRVPDSTARPRVLAQAVDHAMAEGSAGRRLLPPELQAQWDLVLQAFTQAEAGQDEQARANLQGIGLASPFLEWKVLLRGLLAYYQNDDARALENWQRLDAQRLPARLAAPLRLGIDPAYRQAQSPEAQKRLQQQIDKMEGPGLVSSLRAIQANLAQERKLAEAFRQAETILPMLKKEAPQLVPRLAACFFWTIHDHGQPEDVTRYARVFGAPADDPKLARLSALATESRGLFSEAHEYWQDYLRAIEDHPQAWPGDLGRRAQALVWCHMAENAARHGEDEECILSFPPRRGRGTSLTPGPLECYRRSLELVPERLETHRALLDYHLERDEPAKAEKAGKELLRHFPDHAPTLEQLGLLTLEKNPQAALDYLRRALHANPLDQKLRQVLALAHGAVARTHASLKKYDQACAELEAAIGLSEASRGRGVFLCQQAVYSLSGDKPESTNVLACAAAEVGVTAAAYAVWCEAARIKAVHVKVSFQDEVEQALEGNLAMSELVRLVEMVAIQHTLSKTFQGLKKAEKRVLDVLLKALKAASPKPGLGEDELERLCVALSGLEHQKALQQCFQLGQRYFPSNPAFFTAQVEHFLRKPRESSALWRAENALDRARTLADALPRGDRQTRLLDTIQRLHDELEGFKRMAGGDMLDMFHQMFNDPDGPFGAFR